MRGETLAGHFFSLTYIFYSHDHITWKPWLGKGNSCGKSGFVVNGMSDRIECTGQFLSDKKCGVKVELEMYGIANDSVRRKHQTKTINNSICPRWDNEEPFVFAKVMYLHLNGNSAADGSAIWVLRKDDTSSNGSEN